MGSSAKVLLWCATSLIVGIYAISLKSVQTTNMVTAQSHVNRIQNERLIDAALILVLDEVKRTDGDDNKTVCGKHVLGADVTFTISSADGHKANILLTITELDPSTQAIVFQQIVNATVRKLEGSQDHKKGFRKSHRGDWQLASTSIQHG